MSEQTPPPSPTRSGTVPLPEQAQGGAKKIKRPRWAIAFLRALERCGEVRRAAEDSAVDYSTAYARRRAHLDFAAEWDAALAAFRQRRGTNEQETPPSSGLKSGTVPLPIGAAGREELTGDAADQLQPHGYGARSVRPARHRWSMDKERAFFAVLADRANVRAAARAAGVSTQAIYRRRAVRPEFRRQWEAAVETGKARLQMLLMDAAERAFDPELLEVSEEAPKISASEALRLLATRTGKEQELAGWDAAPDGMTAGEEEVADVRAKIARKLDRLNEQIHRDQNAAGWGHDEAYQTLVPPGWVRQASVTIADGGPRGTAARHCPHCGGGLALTVGEADPAPG